MKDWKSRVYEFYMSNGFGDTHEAEESRKRQLKYFKKNYLKYLPEDRTVRILDLGGGMGEFVQFLLSEGYKNCTVIDASHENIEFMKRLFGGRAEIVEGDFIEILKSAEETYDVIVLNDVIEHLDADEIFALLDSIQRALVRGGRFLCKTINAANPITNGSGRYIDITHVMGFTECSMRQLLRATGYRDIRIVGTDVYVLNPIISIPAKLVSKILNGLFFLLNALYGRTSVKIFEKDILAVAYKKG